MEFTKLFKAGLLASTSALALGAAIGDANAQGAPGSNLLGFYAGFGVGFERSSSSAKSYDVYDGSISSPVVYDYGKNTVAQGITGSIFGGYRMAIAGPWVVGGELKLSVSSASGESLGKGDSDNDVAIRFKSRMGLNASLMAGYQMSNGVLPFVKVGYAGKSVHLNGSLPSAGSTMNTTKWLNGIELGAGVDIPMGVIGGAINMPAFLRLDASYTMFSKKKFSGVESSGGGHGGNGPNYAKLNTDTFQAGVSLAVKF